MYNLSCYEISSGPSPLVSSLVLVGKVGGSLSVKEDME